MTPLQSTPRSFPWGTMAMLDNRLNRPDVVFLHGNGCDNDDWQGVFEALGDEYRILAPEFRAHGQSSVPIDPFTLEDLADDVIAVLDDHTLEKACLVGHSLGGMVAMAVARRCDRVGSIVLLEGWTTLAACPAFGSEHQFGRMSDDQAAAIRAKHSAVCQAMGEDIWEAYWQSVEDFDASDFLARTELPILEVYGTMAMPVEPELGLRVPRRPNIQWAWIEEGSHFLPHERPQEVADLCREFIEDVI